MENSTSTNSAPQMQDNSTTPSPAPNNCVAPPPILDIDKLNKNLTISIVTFWIFLGLSLMAKFLAIDGLARCDTINSSGSCTGEAFNLVFGAPVLILLLIITIGAANVARTEAKKANYSGTQKIATAIIFASVAIVVFLIISFIIAVQ